MTNQKLGYFALAIAAVLVANFITWRIAKEEVEKSGLYRSTNRLVKSLGGNL